MMVSLIVLRHGREISDRRYAHVNNVTEEGKQLYGGLKNESHVAEVVREYDRQAAEMRKTKDPQLCRESMGPLFITFRRKSPCTVRFLPSRASRALTV